MECLRCTEEHSYLDCKATLLNYKCSNYDGNHSAVSKDCLVLKKHQQYFENKSQRTKQQDFIRVYSSAPNKTPPKPSFLHSDYTSNQNQQNQYHSNEDVGSLSGVNQINTGTFLSFITELVINISSITANIEEQNGTDYLQIIQKFFGEDYRNQIQSTFFTEQDHMNTFNSSYDEI